MLSSSYATLVLSLSLFPFFSDGAPPLHLHSRQHRDIHGHGLKRNHVVGFVTDTETQLVTLTVTATRTVTPSSPPSASSAAAANANVSSPVATADSSSTDAPSQAASAPASAPSQPESDVVAASAQHPLIMAYYPDWSSMDLSLVDFKLFDWIDFAFAVPTAESGLTWDDPKAPGMLRKLVSAAHEVGTKVKLSIGGWSGSRHITQAVSTDESRKAFAGNILTFYAQYNVDGIDIDWEYPGQVGASGNKAGPKDSANFLLFLQLLKATLPVDARITAAVQSDPFAGTDGNPMDDVSAFAGVLDWVLIMNYDVWGSSSSPGPNAPLYDRCRNSTQPDSNAYAGFHAWTSAGFPASQIVLGLPSYGYVSKSTAKKLRQRSDAHLTRPHAHLNEPAGASVAVESHEGDAVEVVGDDADDDAGDDSGQIQFNALIAQGALVRDSNSSSGDDGDGVTTYTASGGFTRYWDDCSSTPFLRSAAGGGQLITYDDPESIAIKAAFAARVGMLGVNLFDVHGDSAEWDLTHAARRGLLLKGAVV